ncbi:uncharacterized protein PITG_05278 [Phytophthora infestans T30-4]|uniref:PHD-type domain-containing protein n=1 Tax=Phytophthora infestans (strain T30-4) TaxID=403677 RepID=D0N3Z1_PHYIT|nr:uncharacterized protein PITG_05278 [Phytophthora infestans T30-4]EEY69095.1 conserved hypothetical protein [Phytophthora infestans T30-4]|eukprot:XP_002998949.1 conserved hypothetical protein [Phytophthora infestans T30-4]
MVMISSRPFGLGITSSNEGQGIHLHAGNTRNVAVNAALKRGVIQDGDEIFAFNDQVLRGSDLESFKEEVVPAVSLPARCWFRTKRKNKINTREGDVGVVSLGIDWPWVFLRSDGKLAMNLFWKSLDSAFFLRKINKRTLSQLQQRVEEMCGVRLSRSHPEYEQVHELLVMPRRKRMPAYLVDFRKTREQKQQFLSSDVLMGVSSEPKDAETELDEDTPLEVGTTVNVAKRTWPGMNKLGGVGRIKKVNEEIIANGRRRFTYNVAYVLSGSDRNVERKYISVVDLDADEVDKKEETSSTSTGRRHKSEPEADTKDIEETEAADTLSVSLVFALSRTAVEDQVTELPDAQMDSPPKRRRFQLQFSTENEAVHCERKTESSNPDLSARELLLHRHFSVKADDAIVNDCFSSQLLSVEDRAGDELDDDDTDNEDEEDEIKTELTTLQTELRAVIESNELVFKSLTKKMEEEYASKEYRQKMLQDIEWRNYERMYQELQAAKRQFADSDEENISFGGMFVNKLKQEGSEVCALCELSGGDFTGTDSGSVVHPQCAMFTPETFFKDGVVHGINLVDPERRRLKCSICGGCKGLSKIQCAHRKCVRAYHVACAFVNGLLTRDPYYQAWCPRHLKTSGMGQFVEIPDHLNKDKSALVNRNRKDTTPAEVTTTAPTDISSSKTNRKRKRKGSNAKEPRCARRLEIELSDDSDHEGKAVDAWQQGRDPLHVFNEGNVVEVLARDWRGINKPGGVARVRGVEVVPNLNGGKNVFYDVVHIVGAFKEKRLPAKFVRRYQPSDG